jgi:hypothetical protein
MPTAALSQTTRTARHTAHSAGLKNLCYKQTKIDIKKEEPQGCAAAATGRALGHSLAAT